MTQIIDQSTSHVTTVSPDQLPEPQHRTALAQMADRFHVPQNRLMEILQRTVIKTRNGIGPSSEEVAAFIIVANQYKLNPLTREIHAFVDGQRGLVPIVGIDGWTNIANNTGILDGIEFDEEDGADGKPIAIACIIWVKGREHPVKVRERYKECYRNTPPWNQMPYRMLRHKAFIQCARVAFSIGGIFDEDEARDIERNTGPVTEPKEVRQARTADNARRITQAKAAQAQPTHESDQFREVDGAEQQQRTIEQDDLNNLPTEHGDDQPAQEQRQPTLPADLDTMDLTDFVDACVAADTTIKAPLNLAMAINAYVATKGDKLTAADKLRVFEGVRDGKVDISAGTITHKRKGK